MTAGHGGETHPGVPFTGAFCRPHGVVSGLLLTLLVCAACDQSRTEGRSPRDPVVRDSAGIEIVDLGRVRYADLRQWRIGERPTLEIGRIEGEEPYLLYQVPDALVMPDGRVAVISSHQVRMFDPEGRHLWSQGREGDGPGTYRGPYDLSRVHGDSLVVSDGWTFTVLDPAGAFVRQIRPDPVTTGPQLHGVTLAGEVLAWECERVWYDAGSLRENRIMCDRFLTDLEGRVTAQLGRIMLARTIHHPTRQLTTEEPWQKRPVAGPAREGMWFGSGNGYELRLHRDAPMPAKILRWAGPDLTVTAQDVRSYDQKIESQNLPEAHIEFEKSIPKPERIPPFMHLRVDGLGRFWLLDYERWDREDPPVRRWTVVDPVGARILARFEHDRESWLLDAGDGWVLLRELDELEVEHVRMYPLVEAGDG